MGEITERSDVARSVLTWVVPPVLTAASFVVGHESIRWASGMAYGETTPALDMTLLGLAGLGCIVCFILPRSALVTAAGQVAALWYYTEFYLDHSTNQLGGLVYLVMVPAALVCATCGLVAFLLGRSKRPRAASSVTPT